jgi:hypothetical protein
LRSAVWYDSDTFKDNSKSDFAEHGHSISLCELPRESGWKASTDNYLCLDTLCPPQHTCTNASCSQSETGKLLKQVDQCKGVLYTFPQGAHPICLIHLYCECGSLIQHICAQ